MSDYRKGSFKLKNKEIKLIVIGDDIFLSHKKTYIPNKQGRGYIEGGYVFFDKKYGELDSSGKEAVEFNAYDGYPINETWRKGLHVPVALVVSKEYDEGQTKIIHSRSTTLNITLLETEIKKQEEKKFAVFLGTKDKMAKLNELCSELNIKPENVLYFDNNLDANKDKELLNSVGLVVCPATNNNYDNVVSNDRLIKVDAKTGDALIRVFSDTYIENTLEKAKAFHGETKHAFESTPIAIRGSKNSTKKTKLLIFDIDGTCTNNMKIYSVDGNEFKRFALKDLDSLRECLKKGYDIAFMTGDETSIPKNLVASILEDGETKCSGCISYEINAKPFSKVPAKEFREKFIKEFEKLDRKNGVKEVFLVKGSSQKKVDIASVLCEELGFTLDEVAYMGDENNDRGIEEFVIINGGIGACPANGTKEIKATEGIKILNSKGGEGNVQEFIEYVYKKN